MVLSHLLYVEYWFTILTIVTPSTFQSLPGNLGDLGAQFLCNVVHAQKLQAKQPHNCCVSYAVSMMTLLISRGHPLISLGVHL